MSLPWMSNKYLELNALKHCFVYNLPVPSPLVPNLLLSPESSTQGLKSKILSQL